MPAAAVCLAAVAGIFQMEGRRMHSGYVKAVVVDRGFGFIAGCAAAGRDVFFHCSALRDLEFNEQLTGREIQFELVDTDRGLQANDVRSI